ncbi:hypothetical protein [Nocardia carnea]|uniref:hypothetical protein n=1 Tax=Nocardia carnea TaxID=37328 RepID=UPI0024567292|nr:hypothetical protein [Nocardia carnea]
MAFTGYRAVVRFVLAEAKDVLKVIGYLLLYQQIVKTFQAIRAARRISLAREQ